MERLSFKPRGGIKRVVVNYTPLDSRSGVSGSRGEDGRGVHLGIGFTNSCVILCRTCERSTQCAAA